MKIGFRIKYKYYYLPPQTIFLEEESDILTKARYV